VLKTVRLSAKIKVLAAQKNAKVKKTLRKSVQTQALQKYAFEHYTFPTLSPFGVALARFWGLFGHFWESLRGLKRGPKLKERA
jgi:hypothetical protein